MPGWAWRSWVPRWQRPALPAPAPPNRSWSGSGAASAPPSSGAVAAFCVSEPMLAPTPACCGRGPETMKSTTSGSMNEELDHRRRYRRRARGGGRLAPESKGRGQASFIAPEEGMLGLVPGPESSKKMGAWVAEPHGRGRARRRRHPAGRRSAARSDSTGAPRPAPVSRATTNVQGGDGRCSRPPARRRRRGDRHRRAGATTPAEYAKERRQVRPAHRHGTRPSCSNPCRRWPRRSTPPGC